MCISSWYLGCGRFTLVTNTLFVFFLDKVFSLLCDKLLSSSTMFLLPSVGCLLPGTAKDTKLSSILTTRHEAANKPVKSGNDHTGFTNDEPVRVELLESAVCEGNEENELPHGARLTVGQPQSDSSVCVSVPVDSLAIVSWDTSVGDMITCLKEGLCRQLDAVKDCILWKVTGCRRVSESSVLV